MLEPRRLWLLTCCWLMALAPALPAAAQTDSCTTNCHVELTTKRFVHGGVQIGCTKCHSELDAGTTPHKSSGRFAKGLKAEGPALCEACHDTKLFEGRFVHAPVAAGQCLACHDPHASDHSGLTRKAPAEQCLDCHAEIRKRAHVVVGFSGGGHPLGESKKEVADPTRAGRPFYCVACHEPHRGERPRLTRFDRGIAGCQPCHKK